MRKETPVQVLERLTEMKKAKGSEYSDGLNLKESYEVHGEIMAALFPVGVGLRSESDFARFGVLNMIVSKLSRYCLNFDKGHHDSVDDLIVYGSMLASLDSIAFGQEKPAGGVVVSNVSVNDEEDKGEVVERR